MIWAIIIPTKPTPPYPTENPISKPGKRKPLKTSGNEML